MREDPNGAPWRLVRSLSSRKERDKTGLTVAEGPPSVMSALESGVDVECVVVSSTYSASPGFLEVERLLASRPNDSHPPKSPRLYVVGDGLFDRMAETRTPQGILCVLPWPFRYPEGPPGSVWNEPLYLYGIDIQDPGNAGTLIRAAASAGASRCLFLGDSVDVFSPKCIRSSAGAVFRVDVAHDPSIDPASSLGRLERCGVHVYKAVPRGGEPPWHLDLSLPSAIVVGNESRGLAPEIVEGLGRKVSVPMPGPTESLNVALASGMILYEVVRQRLQSGPLG